jgi:general secretion pathway protein D
MKRLLVALLIAAAPLSAAVPGAPARAQSGQVLNVQNADIRAFIQDMARLTNRTFIVDPRVQGTVTVASDEPLTRAELLEVLLSTLRANGYVAVPTGAGAYRVVPAEGAAGQPASAGGVAYGFATEIFRLRTVDARQLAETLTPLVGANAVVAATQGNGLIVADYADNLRRIRGLIAQLDQDRATVETLTLQNSSAREMAEVIARLNAVGGAGEGAGAGGGALTVIPVESSNSLLFRGDATAIARAAAIVRDLDAKAQSSGDVRVIRLQHADADQLVPVLQRLVGQTPDQPEIDVGPGDREGGSAGAGRLARRPTAVAGLGQADGPAPIASLPGRPRAVVARYPGANAVIVSGDAAVQKTLADVVRQLDTRREQVLVEALVVEVSDSVAKELGVQLLIAGQEGSGIPFFATNYSDFAPSILGLGGALLGGEILPEDSAALARIREQALIGAGATQGGVGGFGGQSGDALFGVIINAVKRDSDSNLLSTPSVVTLDNHPARFLAGQEVPITTGEVLGTANVNPFRTVERRDVGVQLEVRPQINAGGGVTLHIRQEVSAVAGSVGASTTGELVLNKREIETSLIADDGEIVVVGGLLRDDESVSVSKVPGLGDVPGLGALFRSKSRNREKTNLIVFIRPRVIRDAAEARAVTAPRFDYARQRRTDDSLDRVVREYMQANPPAAPPAPSM